PPQRFVPIRREAQTHSVLHERHHGEAENEKERPKKIGARLFVDVARARKNERDNQRRHHRKIDKITIPCAVLKLDDVRNDGGLRRVTAIKIEELAESA